MSLGATRGRAAPDASVSLARFDDQRPEGAGAELQAAPPRSFYARGQPTWRRRGLAQGGEALFQGADEGERPSDRRRGDTGHVSGPAAGGQPALTPAPG